MAAAISRSRVKTKEGKGDDVDVTYAFGSYKSILLRHTEIKLLLHCDFDLTLIFVHIRGYHVYRTT